MCKILPDSVLRTQTILQTMTFTETEAQGLLAMAKISGKSEILVNLRSPKTRTILSPQAGGDFSFLLEVTVNQKISFKISIHHQEDNTKIGLLRLDYRGIHLNPATITPNLPAAFHPYVGKMFTPDEPHIHFYVCPEDYEPLVWALPVEDWNASIKEVKNEAQLQDAFNAFSSAITYKGILKIDPQLTIL